MTSKKTQFNVILQSPQKHLPESVPWYMVEPLRDSCMKLHGQSLERLDERGGLSPKEFYIHIHGIAPQHWTPIKPEVIDEWFSNWIHSGITTHNLYHDTANSSAATCRSSVKGTFYCLDGKTWTDAGDHPVSPNPIELVGKLILNGTSYSISQKRDIQRLYLLGEHRPYALEPKGPMMTTVAFDTGESFFFSFNFEEPVDE